MTDTRAEDFVLLVRGGMAQREAAREVGFAGGVPSPKARRLLKAAERIDEMPKAVEWLPSRMEREAKALQDAIDARRKKMRDIQDLLQAADLLGV